MPEITEERAKAQRHAYLLSLADQLMTAPTEQLEFMYNETMRRIETQPEFEIYPKIKGVLEQVAEKRWITITEIDGTFRFTRHK